MPGTKDMHWTYIFGSINPEWLVPCIHGSYILDKEWKPTNSWIQPGRNRAIWWSFSILKLLTLNLVIYFYRDLLKSLTDVTYWSHLLKLLTEVTYWSHLLFSVLNLMCGQIISKLVHTSHIADEKEQPLTLAKVREHYVLS